MGLLAKMRERRVALQILRGSSKLLGLRSGQVVRKLQSNDADAKMAFLMAADEVAETEGVTFDPDELGRFLQIILEFIAKLAEIFNW